MTFGAITGTLPAPIFFVAVVFAAFRTGLSRDRRQPPFSRGDHLRGILSLYAIVALAMITAVLLRSSGVLFFLAVPALLVAEHFRASFSVRRLSDIAGVPYEGTFLALLSFTLPMVVYLCLRKEQTLPRIDIEVF